MISIFAKPAFLNTNPHEPYKKEIYHGRGHLQRVSSIIRGNQIANKIGARLNPKSNVENDICIYVKPHLKKGNMKFPFKGRKSYLDIIDGHNLGNLARNYPNLIVIVCSRVDYETMNKAIPNRIVLIPQHHCNFKRIKKKVNKIKTIGVVGVERAFDYLPENLEEELEKRDIKLLKFSKFFERQDIIDFYKKIDLQIVWRPYRKILSNPLKIVNAASFGIITIALDEPAFFEMTGCYLPVSNFPEFLLKLDNLRKRPDVYELVSKRCLERAESYHIDNISKLYRRLE